MSIWLPKRLLNFFFLKDHEPAWDDLRFPFTGRNIDTTTGRIGYDYADLGVFFAANARYDVAEQMSMTPQMPHQWKLESELRPHIHWLQSQAAVPNFMIEYRVYKNGDAPPAVWQKEKCNTAVFTYTSGTILQLSSFPAIDMTGIDTVSAFIDIKFFRDTANASGLFDGADPVATSVTVKEFDIHYQIDAFGSFSEFTKTIS